MRWRGLPTFLLLRRLVRELSGIREQLTLQTALLTRQIAVTAPEPPPADPQVVREETGLSYVDGADQALLLDYIARTEAATGHRPTDDECLAYLSDEKTVDLHRRLVERDAELERQQRERA